MTDFRTLGYSLWTRMVLRPLRCLQKSRCLVSHPEISRVNNVLLFISHIAGILLRESPGCIVYLFQQTIVVQGYVNARTTLPAPSIENRIKGKVRFGEFTNDTARVVEYLPAVRGRLWTVFTMFSGHLPLLLFSEINFDDGKSTFLVELRKVKQTCFAFVRKIFL